MEPDTQDSHENIAPAVTNSEEGTSRETLPATDAPSFGWNAYAERINGRFAMVGFVALLILEFITRQDFFTWLGF